LKLYPDFQDHARDELESILIGNPEYVSRMLDGLRKAGLDVDTAGNLADGFSPKKITGVTVVTMLEGNVKGSGS
jgi:hypothetical protein